MNNKTNTETDAETDNSAAGDPNAVTRPFLSKLTVGRLYSLGNYEHIRYELTVQIPAGNDPSKTLTDVESIIDGLNPKPPHSNYDLQHAKSQLSKSAGELQDWEVSNLDGYRRTVEECEAHNKKRDAARQALADLGGTHVYTDAKDEWSEDF